MQGSEPKQDQATKKHPTSGTTSNQTVTRRDGTDNENKSLQKGVPTRKVTSGIELRQIRVTRFILWNR